VKKLSSCLPSISASARKPNRKPRAFSAPPSGKPQCLREDAKAKTEEYVSRRTAMAEQKIRQAEADAINEVRASAVDLAIVAAEKLIASKVDSKASGELFKASLGDLKTRLN
jgi:hypothetical protein